MSAASTAAAPTAAAVAAAGAINANDLSVKAMAAAAAAGVRAAVTAGAGGHAAAQSPAASQVPAAVSQVCEAHEFSFRARASVSVRGGLGAVCWPGFCGGVGLVRAPSDGLVRRTVWMFGSDGCSFSRWTIIPTIGVTDQVVVGFRLSM